MTTFETDPWDRWYATYLAHRATLQAAKRLVRERSRAANTMAGLLVAYMIVGGVVASITVGLVLAN